MKPGFVKVFGLLAREEGGEKILVFGFGVFLINLNLCVYLIFFFCLGY